MEEIIEAIRHAAEAGKLRRYVQENGQGLAGLERLADRHSAASAVALKKMEDALRLEMERILPRDRGRAF